MENAKNQRKTKITFEFYLYINILGNVELLLVALISPFEDCASRKRECLQENGGHGVWHNTITIFMVKGGNAWDDL